MQCPDCGAFITKDDLFCGECGRPLAGDVSPASPGTPLEAKDQAIEPLIVPPRPPAAPRKRPTWLPILVVAGFGFALLCACVLLVLVRSVLRSDSTSTSVTNTPAAGSLIFADDFSDPGSGWDIYSEDDTAGDYVDGEYELGVYQDNYVTWGNPEGQQFTNLQIEVDARTVQGPLDNNFGILVRYQPDDDNFYWFEISADGYYSVDLMQAGEWVGLVDWTESDAINQGLEATNHLVVVCNRDQFTFYVNDTYLTVVSDATFAAGNIGLAAGTYDEPGVVVHFDNLEVYGLQE
jgi:hypothetical protein